MSVPYRSGSRCLYGSMLMWCDLVGSVRTRTCDIFSFLFEMITWRGTFWWKLHLNRSSSSKVMSNWRVLRTIENNRNSFLFLAISHNQCCQLLIPVCEWMLHVRDSVEIYASDILNYNYTILLIVELLLYRGYVCGLPKWKAKKP